MARIIQARAIISGEEKVSPLLDKLSKKFDQVRKTAKAGEAVGKMADQLDRVKSQLAAIEKFNASKMGFANARTRFRETQAAVEGAARAMREGKGDAAALEAAYRRAQSAVSASARQFEAQKAALLSNHRALRDAGIDVRRLTQEEQRLSAAVRGANAALDGQARRGGRIRAAAGQAVGAGGYALGALGMMTGHYAMRFGRKAVASAGEFDIATRKQRVFTDIDVDTQRRLLLPQAKRIGQETPFTNLDVVRAQTAAMQGLPSDLAGPAKAEVAAGMVEYVKYYATLMEVDLKEAAEAIRGYLQQTGKDLSTRQSALKESQKAVNQIVKMAKLGGMSGDDAQQYLKYAAAASHASGVSPEAMLAIGALARRGGLRGDEAGTFMRTVAAKLVAPGKKGLTALAAAGIDYSSYVTMPNRLDAGRLEMQLENQLGIKMSPAVQARVQKLLADRRVIGSQGAFQAALIPVLEQAGLVGSGGGAASKSKIAGALGGFYQASAQSVDAGRLLADLVANKDISLAQLNMLLGYRMGGRGAITTQQRDEFIAARKALGSAGDDPDFAKNKFNEITGGEGYAIENLKGSIENLTLSIGEANSGVIKFTADTLGHAFDWVSELSTTGRQVVTVLGGIAAAGATVGGFKLLMSGFGLKGSAVALDGSAAALTRAAMVLAGSGGVKAAATAGGVAAGAGARGATSFMGTALGYTLGTAAGAAGFYFGSTEEANAGEGDIYKRNPSTGKMEITPYGKSLWEGAGIPGKMETPIEAELKGSAEVKGEAKVTIDLQGLGISRQWGVNVPLSGQFHTNGPGSLGTSSPDADKRPVAGP